MNTPEPRPLPPCWSCSQEGLGEAKTKPAGGIKLVDLDRGSNTDREIKRLGERLGISLSSGAIGFVKTMLGEDMNLIKNELGKISLYVEGKKSIGEKDLRELIEKRSTENVFSLSTALSNRDLRGLSGYFGNLRETGRIPSPYFI